MDESNKDIIAKGGEGKRGKANKMSRPKKEKMKTTHLIHHQTIRRGGLGQWM